METMPNLYIGLISGTSADAIDAVLVDFKDDQSINILATYSKPFDVALQTEIIRFNQSAANELDRLSELDVKLGHTFADVANELLKKANIDKSQIKAIGSHGQNIRHRPSSPYPFTLQIGDPNIIAIKTGIKTIADFRRKDVALGGQGAPLAPGIHQYLFRNNSQDRIVLNTGGIANITVLPKDFSNPVIGFDTGPASCLMDAWIHQHQNKSFDNNGAWAKTGKVLQPLLTKLLSNNYFSQPAPKSTGRELFNVSWLNQHLTQQEKPEDVQATLLELTVRTIAEAIKKYFSSSKIIVCGGGVHNEVLMTRLAETVKPMTVDSSQQYGVDPDFVEALLFAWLAKQNLESLAGNLTSVTGAEREAVLGGVYAP